MTLEEWHAVLAAEPATANQRGAVMREFGRLGFGAEDRPARLAACAALLGLDELDTTADLTMGQAGQLVGTLTRFADRGELAAATATGEDRMTLAQALTRMAAVIALSLRTDPLANRARVRPADQPGTRPGEKPR